MNDLSNSIKNKLLHNISDLKVIVGEIQRLPEKNPSDNEVLKILNKLIKYEKINLADNETSTYLKLIESYLPTKVSEEQIELWIKENIEFEKLKNKMMAIRFVLDHFGAQTDGGTVKKILMEKF